MLFKWLIPNLMDVKVKMKTIRINVEQATELDFFKLYFLLKVSLNL